MHRERAAHLDDVAHAWLAAVHARAAFFFASKSNALAPPFQALLMRA